MQLIACPWCGPREEAEFHYGGQAHVAYPEDPAALTDERVGALRVLPRQPQGPVRRALEPQRRLPPLVQRRPRHRHLPLRERLPERRDQPHDASVPPRVAGSTATPPSTSPSTGSRTTATPATPWPRRCSPTACTRSPRASSSAGPAASSRPGPRTPAAWSRSRSHSPSRCCWPRRSSCYDGLVARGLPGQGRLAEVADPARYDAMHAHGDVLVVGAGPAGLTAALAAARPAPASSLVDEQTEAGGSLLGHRPARRRPALDWVAAAVAELADVPRRAAPAAHHRLRPLRRRPRARARAPHRPPRRGGARARLPPAGLAHPRPHDRGRHRRPRAPGRLRRQRPPGHHARRRRPDVPAPLRRARRAARPSSSPPTTAPTPPRFDLHARRRARRGGGRRPVGGAGAAPTSASGPGSR